MIATLLGRMYIMQRPLVFVTNLYSPVRTHDRVWAIDRGPHY